jgi:large subunit ribosomal protein L19
MAGNKINKIKFSPVDIEERKKLDFKAGDTVNVSSKILDEKGKYRLQAFEGIVLARKHGKEVGATFTVRKVASGVGVERIFPLYSPMIGKIEITKRSRARRSKLYYIRTKAIKDVRGKMRSVANQEGEEAETEVAEKAE